MQVSSAKKTEEKEISTKEKVATQFTMPQHVDVTNKLNEYDIFPFHSLGSKKIFSGYNSLAKWMAGHRQIIIDGYSGVMWNEVTACLQQSFAELGCNVKWISVEECMKSTDEIQAMVAPFLGSPGSVWGTRSNINLQQFFETEKLAKVQPDDSFDITIAYGTGAGLLNWNAPVVFLDVPKNEIQYRMRASETGNLGTDVISKASETYKRFYFVDWVVLNAHRKSIFNKVLVVADTQWRNEINWIAKKDLEEALEKLSHSVMRARPWFDPGVWGGQWMKERIKGLDKRKVNYAWSFELIVPENGVVFESDGKLLEVPFDMLMMWHNKEMIGKHASFFGEEFPIRFDFLDTWDGENLSIQCHPSLEYIRKNFGEHITQDETYYMLDCKNGAQVYLGFQDSIEPTEFKTALEYSQENKVEIDIKKYVQSFEAHKHDLFLIPNGTVHSSGVDNLVLEISATPYIFTFKMYDWVRLDLNGEPRPINIDHAFNNLNFDRKGDRVEQELISKQTVIDKGADWQLVHLPTHADHFYDVERVEFDTTVTLDTNDSVQVLMLVEGSAVSVTTEDGSVATFRYAETFVIPAAAKTFSITNNGKERAKVVRAFLKENIDRWKK
ncbi:class I mannose-6-phosphate isomerase [Pinibacter aurantiacus]|uniref:Class I mannose-6-phosphate isomerase n=1 Tax=Pinibacter aurantiacus TaxID=2851599 RepID=A0A9E2SBS7_9BACT|nr:class I mannose-6-phosphate isomerase [Pinibacter aurantiacus]MBV4358214.1 class I mannose-6-phosphate isomerase [Pinibacter aurantiacus]